MVMHARKLPRINDGYYDCSDYHDLKNGNSDRSSIRDRRLRDDSTLTNDRRDSPTYKHKSISAERRNIDRDRYERYKHEYGEEGNRSSEKNSMNLNDRLSGRNHLADSKSMDARTNMLSNVSRLKDVISKTEEVKRINSVTKSNSSGSAKDPRLEAQKTALRVCGDWSEHVSSSGKKYFYNCKTEVSQWVKPKEWKVEEGVKQGPARTASTVSSKGGEETCKNGLPGTTDSPNTQRHDKLKLSDDSRRSAENHRPRDEKGRDGYTRNNNVRDEQTLTSKEVNNYQALHVSSNRGSSVTSTPSSSIMDTTNGSPAASTQQDRTSSERLVANGVNDGSGDDMDISPDASPRPTDLGVSSQKPAVADRRSNTGSTVQGSQSSNPDQSMIWGKALETLQTLQEVLGRSQSAPSQTEPNAVRPSLDSPRSATSQSSPRVIASLAPTVPPVADVFEALPSAGEMSPVSEKSLGQHSALSQATESISNAVMLPQSLINYYDASLLDHISGWPAEQIELRAHMAYRDGLVICGHHCGRVSTELKRDRSHVRIAEVQSTLIEHRILFLKQQIAELETNDRNFSSGMT